MIRAELRALLTHLPGPPLDPEDPELPAHLGDLADLDPVDADLRAAMLAAHARATAERGLPARVAGVRRDVLVRWDDWTATWVGPHAETGRSWMLRLLRPEARQDPYLRRRIGLDAAALAEVVPGLVWVTASGPVSGDHPPEDPAALLGIGAPLPGPAFVKASPGGKARSAALASLVVRTVAHVKAWADAGLGFPARLDPTEIRDADDHLAMVLLTPHAPGGAGDLTAFLARGLRRWWRGSGDHALADLLDGLVAAPPDDLDDAAERCVAALAEELADVRHGLVRRAADSAREDQRERLVRALADLDAAMPPPEGRAALGVDLDGATLIVACDGQTVAWGPVGAAADTVWDEDEGFDVPMARRLVRARGAAPVSDRLNADIGGDPAYADRIARWVAAGLELRTLRLILDATG